MRTNLFLATHSETNCCSLLSVAVISVAVVADEYSLESSVYALLKASGMSFVKIEKSKGPRQLPWGIPDSTWIMLERLPLKNTVRQLTLYPQYSRGCKALTHTFLKQQTMIDNVKSSTEV
jgi:hypothetical protein